MRLTLIALLALTFTLAACTPAPTATTTPTSTVSPTATTAPTASPTATTTQVIEPNMENLPAEWQGKIDHIETMTNMDGKTTRVVAIESLKDEDKAAGKTEAKLRVLQWDGKEWVSYVPQVGLISTSSSYWDAELEGGKTILSDDLPSQELQKIIAEPIYGKNGQEIKNGLVADFADATLFCGDLVEVVPTTKGRALIMEVEEASGDVELFILPEGAIKQDGIYITAYDQNSVDGSMAHNPLDFQQQEVRDKISSMGTIPLNLYIDYIKDLKSPKRMLFAVEKSDYVLMSNDDSSARKQVVHQILVGEGFNAEGIGIMNANYFFISEKDFQALQANH